MEASMNFSFTAKAIKVVGSVGFAWNLIGISIYGAD